MSRVPEKAAPEASPSVRFALIRLLERGGPTLGLSRTMIDHLAYLVRHTREVDWQPGNRAIVYKSVTNMARDHGVTERQINNRERELIDILELRLELSGNFRRYGERDADTGRIKRAFGIDVTPLKTRIPALEKAVADQEEAEERWRERKQELSALKGRIRKLTDAAIGLGLADAAEAVLDRCAGYRDRVRAETPTEEIERRILCAAWVKDQLERAILLGKTDERPVKTSDRAEADFRHKDLPNDILTNDESFEGPPPVDHCPTGVPGAKPGWPPLLPGPSPQPAFTPRSPHSRNLPNAERSPGAMRTERPHAPFRKETTGEENLLKIGGDDPTHGFISPVILEMTTPLETRSIAPTAYHHLAGETPWPRPENASMSPLHPKN